MELFFKYTTPIIYWLLVLAWSFIFVFYIRKIKLVEKTDKLLKLLLLILSIDAFRTLFESIYFGAWYTSLSELIPIEIFNYLAQPQIVFFPKIINLITAVLVFALIIKKWLSAEITQKNARNDLIKKQLNDLIKTNEELQKSKEIAEKSEEKYRKIIETTSHGFWLLNKFGKFIDVNPAYCQLVGYTRDELILMSISDIEYIETKEDIKQRTETVIKTGHQRFETIHKHKNGNLIHVEISTSYFPLLESEFVVFIHDITQRKKDENQILEKNSEIKTQNEELLAAKINAEESEEQLRLITDNLPVFISHIDKNLNYLFANKMYNEVLGLKPENIIGKSVAEILGKETLQKALPNIKKVLAGENVHFDNFGVDKNGETRFIQTIYIPQIKENEVADFFVLAWDITERKQAEQALKESEEKFRQIVEMIGEGVGFVNNEETFEFANTSAEKIFDLDKGKLTGKNLSEFLSKNEFGKIKEQTDSRKIGLTNTYDLEIITAIGNIKSIAVTVTPHFDTKNNFLGSYGVFRDITERKIAEQSLTESEEQLKLVLKGSNLGFWDWNIETNEVQRNVRWAEMLGYTLEEIKLTVKQWTDLIHPEDREKALLSLNNHLEGKTLSHQVEYRMLTKEQKWIWIFDSAIIVKKDKNGKPIRMTGTHTDITERKKDELLIQLQNKELQELNANKDRFVSILAHDLKNPFSSLLGFSGLLAKNIRKYNIDKIESQVKIIDETTRRTFNLLEDLLMWANAHSGKLPFEPIHFNYTTISNEVIESLKFNTENKNLTINNISAPEIQIYADINMFKTILRNLVSNAIKFTENSGAINLKVSKFENLKMENEFSNFHIISVSDTGTGIEPEKLNKLFEISYMQSTAGT